MAVLIAQLSDPHLGGSDGAAAALARAVAAVAELRPAPAAVLLTGDVADSGAAAEYALARELLAPLAMPVHVLPGNHDDGAALRAQLDAPAAAGYGPLRILLLDTTEPGRAGGRLGPERLEALAGALAAAPDAPTLIAMHHPPILSGIRAIDQIGLAPADRAALAALLARHPQVRRIAAGHVHRTLFGELAGRGVFVCPGTHRQLALDLSGSPELAVVDEPPGYALHLLLDGGEIVTHVQLLD
jgi:Icc protein